LAKHSIPDPLTRRLLIERELDASRALALAEAYIAEERWLEAIAFLRKAGAEDRLETLTQEAVRAGDAFLLRELSQALGREPDAQTWLALAEAAATAGRDRYAVEARRQAERLANRRGE
jgi:hypothetical protein